MWEGAVDIKDNSYRIQIELNAPLPFYASSLASSRSFGVHVRRLYYKYHAVTSHQRVVPYIGYRA